MPEMEVAPCSKPDKKKGLSVSSSGTGVKQGILKESRLKIKNKLRGVGNINIILQEERLKTFGDIDIDHIMNFELMREV